MIKKTLLFLFFAVASSFSSIHAQEAMMSELQNLTDYSYKKIGDDTLKLATAMAGIAAAQEAKSPEQIKQQAIFNFMSSLKSIELIEGPVNTKAFAILNKGMKKYGKKHKLNYLLEQTHDEPVIIVGRDTTDGYYDEILAFSSEEETRKIVFMKMKGKIKIEDFEVFILDNFSKK